MRTVFDVARNESGLVDRYIGTAFDIVKCVHDHLAEVKQVSFYMESLVTIDNNMDKLQAIYLELAKLDVIYDNLPMLRELWATVNYYLTALGNYKQALAGSGGANLIGTAGGDTVQVALDKANQSLSVLQENWETYEQTFANLMSNAMYHATTNALALALAQKLKNGDLVLVHVDETKANAPVLYTVGGGATKTLTLFLNLDELTLAMADPAEGSGLVGHTNADASVTTVKALLNKHTADIAAVKQTADNAATASSVTTLTARVAALEAKP